MAVCAAIADKAKKIADAAGVDVVDRIPCELFRRTRTSTRWRSARRRGRTIRSSWRRSKRASMCCAKSRSPWTRAKRRRCATSRRSAGARQWSRTNSAIRRSARYIKQLVADGYIGRFNLCTIELFLDRYVTPQPRPASWQAFNERGRRYPRRARIALHRWVARLVRRSGVGAMPSGHASPRSARCGDRQGRQGRVRRHVFVHAQVRERRHGDDDRVVRDHADPRRPASS